MKIKINLSNFRKNLISSIQKTILLNILIAFVVSSLIFYENINNQKFEHTIEIKLSKRVFNIYNLFTEDHVNEIFHIIEKKRKSDTNKYASVVFKKNKLRKGAKISWEEGYSNLFIENRFHGINYDNNVKKFFDEMIIEVINSYYKSVNDYIIEENLSLLFLKKLNSQSPNSSIMKKIQAKEQRIEGLSLMIDNDLNYIKHYVVDKKFNLFFPPVVAFLFSFFTFICLLGVYNVGSVSFKNSN